LGLDLEKNWFLRANQVWKKFCAAAESENGLAFQQY